MRLRLAVPAIALLLVAGCGGTQVTVQEVPGDPVELEVPGGGDALAPAATAEATATATPTPGAETASAPTPDPNAADATGEQAPEGTEGGGTAAPDEEGDPGQAQEDPEQVSDFCAMNPGAC